LNKSKYTRFPLTIYSCEEIKGAIINDSCLKKGIHEWWGSFCYEYETMDSHYKYRCK